MKQTREILKKRGLCKLIKETTQINGKEDVMYIVQWCQFVVLYTGNKLLAENEFILFSQKWRLEVESDYIDAMWFLISNQ